ncbi:MAG: DUF4225 domain-containing protein [Hafnia alvei]|uniref:DUF4225 domain-containing protein n=1 Tax=Hafnia alvei TaxID=569 RepID=UPI00291072B1|nr:DUF4225 domain-containing protein [Hafnia alvei]MDU7480891.1 DUF4225 domain-containing protein [Hafnia alvei]
MDAALLDMMRCGGRNKAWAETMGFSRNSGLGIYKSVSLAANAYSIFGLFRRPGAWRLFRYLPADYYRKVSTMSRPKLTIKLSVMVLKLRSYLTLCLLLTRFKISR